MLLRYKNMHIKPQGVPVVIPFESRMNHSARLLAKVVVAAPFAEMPDRDALLYAKADPHNFEVVKEGDAPEAAEVKAEGLELDPDPKSAPKKRGRKSKADLEAMSV